MTGLLATADTKGVSHPSIYFGRVLGVRVDATDYEQALGLIMQWAASGESRYICEAPVHSVMEARADERFRKVMEKADLVTPGGMPLVWMLRWMGFSNQPRVYGPDLMLRTCGAAAAAQVSVGLYGSTPHVLGLLARVLPERYPALKIDFFYSPPFRDLTFQEDEEVVANINDAGVKILFVGLGCPRQEKWMAQHRTRLRTVMLGVGAAFDFISGNKPQAPPILQSAGLEWAFRLATEPTRLWHRYLYYNPKFLLLAAAQLIRGQAIVQGIGSDTLIRHSPVLFPLPDQKQAHCSAGGYSAFALIKRSIDVSVAVLLLLALLRLFVLIASAIFINSPGPILYRQRRVGLRGEEFLMLKFRTMHPNACTLEPSMRNGTLVKMKQDSRLTPLGVRLRRWSLDELPQLWNVLRGEMSIVGPRPLPRCMLTASPSLLSERAMVRPGLTGLWQTRARDQNTSIGDMLDHDLEYVRALSLSRDCFILVKTLAAVFHGRGAV